MESVRRKETTEALDSARRPSAGRPASAGPGFLEALEEARGFSDSADPKTLRQGTLLPAFARHEVDHAGVLAERLEEETQGADEARDLDQEGPEGPRHRDETREDRSELRDRSELGSRPRAERPPTAGPGGEARASSQQADRQGPALPGEASKASATEQSTSAPQRSLALTGQPQNTGAFGPSSAALTEAAQGTHGQGTPTSSAKVSGLPSVPRASAAPLSSAKLQQPAPATPSTLRAEKMLDALRVAITPRTKSATLRLDPAELGRLKVELRVDRGQVHAHLLVERPEALHALQAWQPELRALFEQQGLELAGFSLDLAPGGRENPFEGDSREGDGPMQTQEPTAARQRLLRALAHDHTLDLLA